MGKKFSDEQIERIRKLYEDGNTQVTIAKEMNISQSTISRVISGEHISTTPASELRQLLQNSSIFKVSTFFIAKSCLKVNRERLKKALFSNYGDTTSQYGIVRIEEISNPSGLLIYTLDHNFEYKIQELLSKEIEE